MKLLAFLSKPIARDYGPPANPGCASLKKCVSVLHPSTVGFGTNTYGSASQLVQTRCGVEAKDDERDDGVRDGRVGGPRIIPYRGKPDHQNPDRREIG